MLQRPPTRSDDRRARQVRDAQRRTRERRRPLDVVRELWPNDNETATLVKKAAVSPSTTSITAVAPTALAGEKVRRILREARARLGAVPCLAIT
jgi:hypothetical protein